MANTIRIKRSTGSSNPTSLENAEIAFREGDEVLIYGTGTGGSGGSATSIIAIGGKGAFFDKATTNNFKNTSKATSRELPPPQNLPGKGVRPNEKSKTKTKMFTKLVLVHPKSTSPIPK